MTNNQRLARIIAEDLFTDGCGVVADRLVSVDEHNRMGFGWGLGPMADRIADILDADKKVKADRQRKRKKAAMQRLHNPDRR